LGVLVREHGLALPLMRSPDERRTLEYEWLNFMAILHAHAYEQALAFEEASLRPLASGAIRSYDAEHPATGTMDPDVREVMSGIMAAASDQAACMEELAALEQPVCLRHLEPDDLGRAGAGLADNPGP
jgi:hypothetical protein